MFLGKKTAADAAVVAAVEEGWKSWQLPRPQTSSAWCSQSGSGTCPPEYIETFTFRLELIFLK